MNREEIALRLLKYRVKKGLTQMELAKQIDISNKTLCFVEKSNPKVRNITLIKVSNKLDELEKI